MAIATHAHPSICSILLEPLINRSIKVNTTKERINVIVNIFKKEAFIFTVICSSLLVPNYSFYGIGENLNKLQPAQTAGHFSANQFPSP